MLLDFFKTKPVLDEESIHWLYETFRWALNNLDANLFYQQTQLVLPDQNFFPDKNNNADEMAYLTLNRVKTYAGLEHWPCKLLRNPPEKVTIPELPVRGLDIVQKSMDETIFFPINYHPALLKNPQALIGHYIQTLAFYALMLSPDKPQDFDINAPQLSEVIGVFMGFGVILTNSAFTFRNKTCGSCNSNTMERQNHLSQYDICYALAIFCVVKEIPVKDVLPSLKNTLRSYFKKAYKEVIQRDFKSEDDKFCLYH